MSEVEVTDALGPDTAGCAVEVVRWRDGLVGRSTMVIEARPIARAPRRPVDGVTALLDRPVVEVVHDLDAGVRVVAGAREEGLVVNLAGWSTPGWAAPVFLGCVVATLLLVGLGPEPRGATRGAWRWLVLLVSPLGAVAYLLVSGVATGRPAGPDDRRLTGGWAFLLAVLLGGALGGVFAAG